MEWEKLYKFIINLNKHAKMQKPEEDYEFLETWELEMAKAMLHDYPDGAVRVSKIILAFKNVDDIKVKID